MKKRWWSGNILAFGMTSFFNDMSYEMINSIFPMYIQSIVGQTTAPFVISLSSGISNFIASIFKIISGYIADVYVSSKKLVIFGYAITPLAYASVGFFQSIPMIIACRAIGWSGKGLREPARDSWLSQSVMQSDRGKAFGFVRMLDSLGAVAGPLITVYLLTVLPLRTLFYISIIPAIFSVGSLAFFTTVLDVHGSKNNQHDVFGVLTFSAIYKSFVFIMFLFSVANYNKMLIIFRALEVFSYTQSSKTIVILLYALFNGVRAISEYVMGALSDRVGRKNVFAYGGFGMYIFSTALMIFSPANSFYWIAIFTLAAISTGTITSVQKAILADIVEPKDRAKGYGFLEALIGFGDILGSVIIGLLWSYVSMQLALSLAIGITLAAAIFFMRLNIR